ncbi:MAG TPA: alpha/beta fold hydrolase [Gammaproteobacteria bacterium]|nr:alpha/beta fold hydrolase [Gammaproteobacteria bacterium]
MSLSSRAALLIGGVVAALYGVVCVLLYVGQRSLLYHPMAESQSPRAQAIRLERDGVSLKIWEIARPGDRALIYFGGNGDNVVWFVDDFAKAFPDRSIYLVNYRGYAGSTGFPTEKALLADAEAVFDKVHESHPDVAVIGRSLGSGVAVYLAGVRDVHKLVLVTPYDSIERLAEAQFGWFPVSLILEDKFDSLARAKKVRSPVLALMAEHDDVVPRASTERLLTAFAAGQAEAKTIAATDHNSIVGSADYLREIAAFLRR